MEKFDLVIILHQPAHTGDYDICSILNAIADREAVAAAESLLDQLARTRGAAHREEALRQFLELNLSRGPREEGEDEEVAPAETSGEYINMGGEGHREEENVEESEIAEVA